MALSSLNAGNSAGVETTVTFNSSPASSSVFVTGLVKGSSTKVQLTVQLDPTSFTCALSADSSQLVVTMIGASRNPTNVVYTVDTGVNVKTALPNTSVLTVRVVPTGGGSGTVYTFTKATGGGIRA